MRDGSEISLITAVSFVVVVFFTGLLVSPFFGFILGDLAFHADLLFSGAGHVAPALFIGALYEGIKS